MASAHVWSASDTARFVRSPLADDDKYRRGVVALRTGSARYPGAAVLGVEGAWRAGAGLVRYVGDSLPTALVLARRPETVVVEGRAGAWVIGSGTDASARTPYEEQELRALLAADTPVVVDAGALDLAIDATAPVIVTPHAGEFSRLCEFAGLSAVGERMPLAIETARHLGVTVLLKGAETVIADPSGAVRLVRSPTSWLAVAGTGDVLAGIVGALVAANPSAALADAAASAAWLHGHAAALAAGAQDGAPGHPIVALDVAEALPATIGRMLRS